MSERKLPTRREALGAAAVGMYRERGLRIIEPPDGFPIPDAFQRGILVWAQGMSPSLVSVPLDELALVTERESVRHLLEWGEQKGMSVVLIIPEATQSYVEDLLSIWGTARGSPYQHAQLQPAKIPAFQLPELLNLARALVDEPLLSKVVILGSAALRLHGLDLNRPPKDLDLFVSAEVFRDWPTQGFRRLPHGDGEKIVPTITSDIEIFKEFPGVTFEEVGPEAVEVAAARPMRVGSLKHLLQWKEAHNRPKDQPDIALLREALAARPTS